MKVRELRVKRLDAGTYLFQLNHRFRKTGNNRVRIHYFREHQQIPAIGESVKLGPGGHLKLRRKLGTQDQPLPPGIYRLVVTMARPPVPVPGPIRRAADFLNREEDLFPEAMKGKAWTYEFAARIGSRSDMERFRRETVHTLSRYGNRLLDAWVRWQQFALKGYKRSADSGDLKADSFSKELLQHLQAVHRATDRFLKNVRDSRRYLVQPAEDLRSDLINFADDLKMGVRSKSVMIVKQVTGKLPDDWPEKYRGTQFKYNVNLAQELAYTYRTSVKHFRKNLKNLSGVRSRLRTSSHYLHWRITRLHQIFRTFQRLTDQRASRRSMISDIPTSTAEQKLLLLEMDRYMERLLSVHADSIRLAVKKWGPARLEKRFDTLLEGIRNEVLLGLARIAEGAGASLPEKLNERMPSDKSLQSLSRERKRVLRQIRSDLIGTD